jgi:hypothetical protein
MKTPRTFVLTTLALVISIATLIMCFNRWHDPFQQYTAHSGRYYAAFQRQQVAGLLKNEVYDRVVIGSSLFENSLPADVDRTLGGHTLNASLSAMSAYDGAQALSLALRKGRAKHVVFGIDYSAFARPIDYLGFAHEPWPHALYDENPFNDVGYLLAASTTEKSIEIATDRRWNRYRTDRNAMWFWGDDAQYGEQVALRGLDLRHINKTYMQPPLKVAQMQRAFEHHIVPLVAQYPNVKFTFVFAPYSKIVWADFAQRRLVEEAIAFKSFIVQTLATGPSAAHTEVFDFQTERAVVDVLDNYKDAYHYGPKINVWMTQQLAGNTYRLDEHELPNMATRTRLMAADAVESLARIRK